MPIPHPDEKVLLYYVLGGEEIKAQRDEIEAHLSECEDCRSLVAEMTEYYTEVDEFFRIQEMERSTALSIRDRIIPYHSFVDRPPVPQDERRLPIRVAQFIIRHPVVSSTSGFAAAAAIVGMLLFSPKDTITDFNPSYARPQGEFLISYNKMGQELWRAHIGPRFDSLDLLAGNKKLIEVADVDNDGTNEVLCAYYLQFGDETKNRKRFLTCYSADGKVRWKRDYALKPRYNGKEYPGDYLCTSIIAGDFDRDGKTDLIAHLENAVEFPAAVVRIDPATGDVLSEFWQAGYLTYFERGDIDMDGIDEIVCGGYTMDRDPVLVVFDPRYIEGYAPIPFGVQPEGMVPGTAKYYLLLPHTWLEGLPDWYLTYPRYLYGRAGRLEIWLQSFYQVGVTYTPHAIFKPDYVFTLSFHFDSLMRVVKVAPFDPTKRVVNVLPLSKELNERVSSERYLDSLRRGVRYWDGDKFVSQATTNRRYRQNPTP
ncbi:MAG: VCBS repeat-containing protein [Ignavibacteriae bacterium]|nr:VCBS repeat-containing protein [Ignavibacteriota bacterium]